MNHRHFKTRNAYIEKRHGGGVDKTKPNPFVFFEHPHPVLLGVFAVHEEGITADIRDVGRRHAHVAPIEPIRDGVGEAFFGDVIEERTEGPLLVVVIVGHFLEVFEDRFRTILGVEIRENDDVFPIEPKRIAFFRFDNNCTVHTGLLLQSGMTVIPISACLLSRKVIGEGCFRLNAGEADARHAILLIRQDEPMPMDRGVFIKFIGHIDGEFFTFFKAQHGSRNGAVDGHRRRFRVTVF